MKIMYSKRSVAEVASSSNVGAPFGCMAIEVDWTATGVAEVKTLGQRRGNELRTVGNQGLMSTEDPPGRRRWRVNKKAPGPSSRSLVDCR